ncbi:DsbA family protein [Palleronia sediminis]|uniref:DsbA family protein n=2 Tax=Palleronia sediminis TaxID=2547833 RepID=A0A4R6A7P4_9RHOB|nr:DsbA family protein [Palleronia sediminis]
MTRTPLAILAATAVIGGGWYMLQPAAPGNDLTPFGATAQEADETAESGDVEIAEMTLGDADAPVKVIEYASFTCPHCGTFHDIVFPELKENYIDTGKVEFTYREVYFDRYGLWAGMVARCGGEDRYFGIADLLYERQREWARGEPAEIAANLKTVGKTAGLTDEQLDACLGDGAKAEALVRNFERNAETHDITSTPSFIIDGEKYSNMSYADFSAVLDEKLGEDS